MNNEDTPGITIKEHICARLKNYITMKHFHSIIRTKSCGDVVKEAGCKRNTYGSISCYYYTSSEISL